jgi:hypothetical protein
MKVNTFCVTKPMTFFFNPNWSVLLLWKIMRLFEFKRRINTYKSFFSKLEQKSKSKEWSLWILTKFDQDFRNHPNTHLCHRFAWEYFLHKISLENFSQKFVCNRRFTWGSFIQFLKIKNISESLLRIVEETS